MSADRRFSEPEVAFILEQASTAPDLTPARSSPDDGLSLAQIREIAREVGIDPSRVDRAAMAVERGELTPARQRTWLGLPIGVSRTIEFGRALSDEEWDQVVILLRETFDARGRLHSDGTFRQWTNGNLQALLERTPRGHRLRLSTRKGDAQLPSWARRRAAQMDAIAERMTSLPG